MKSKSKTYMLLAVVLTVWGLVGYKVLSTMDPEIPEIAENTGDLSFNPKTNTAIDTFSVQALKRDPFLGTLSKKRRQSKTTKPSISKPSNTFVWLPISYQGVVKEQASSQQIFAVTINGRQHLLKMGQTSDSIALLKGNARSIVVRYKNRQKTINIQQ